jgi:molybdate transport system ATP-binding protein
LLNPRLPLLDVVIEPFSRDNNLLQEKIAINWFPGQHWCITGSTGSGKTTLLQLLSGQISSPHAKIRYPLVDEWKLHSDKRFVADWLAYVPQEVKIPLPYFVEDLYYQRRFQSAEQDNIPTVNSILLNTAKGSELTAVYAAQQMKLTEMLDQPFIQLSNGQTRRLMIAVALVKQPQILFLDNPFTGLDQPSRVELSQILKSLADNGTHIMIAALPHEAEQLSFITDVLNLKKEKSFSSAEIRPTFPVLGRDSGEIIRMENFSVGYGKKTVIHRLNWTVRQGEHWVLKGRNGSGKSTLLSVIMGDHPQSYAHDWFLFGKKKGSGESIWDIKQNIGFFSPELLQFMDKTASVETIILSGLHDIPRPFTSTDRDTIRNMAEWLDIHSWLGKPFSQLSFGEQRIVLLARAMVRNPILLILDEPLQGLDLSWRAWMKDKLFAFCRNRTTLYITHDEEEIPEGDWKVLGL